MRRLAFLPRSTPEHLLSEARLDARRSAGDPAADPPAPHGQAARAPRRAGSRGRRGARARDCGWRSTTARPRSACSRRNRSQMTSLVLGSRLPVGSSARINRGAPHERARNGHPLLLPARQLARAMTHAIGEAHLDRAPARPLARLVGEGSRWSRAGSIAFSSAVISPRRLPNWKTKPDLRPAQPREPRSRTARRRPRRRRARARPTADRARPAGGAGSTCRPPTRR